MQGIPAAPTEFVDGQPPGGREEVGLRPVDFPSPHDEMEAQEGVLGHVLRFRAIGEKFGDVTPKRFEGRVVETAEIIGPSGREGRRFGGVCRVREHGQRRSLKRKRLVSSKQLIRKIFLRE
jgi:hypothetical protein